MRILHIVGYKGGGIKRVIETLEDLEEIEQETWVVSENPQTKPDFENFSVIIIHEYMVEANHYNPDGIFNNLQKLRKSKKIFYSHGLAGLSKSMILNKLELRPWKWYKRWKISSWLKQFDYIISVSLTHRYIIKKFYGVESTVIHNGIRFESLPKLAHTKRDSNMILYVGRVAWRKGVERFFKLMRNLPMYKGIIIGIDPDEMNFSDSPQNIEIVGRVENPYEYMVKSKYVVNVSYYDPCPITILESLHYGTPVLVMKDSGGPWEILQLLGEYQWGFDSIEQMANYIKNTPMQTFSNKKLLHSIFNDLIFKQKFLKFVKLVLET